MPRWELPVAIGALDASSQHHYDLMTDDDIGGVLGNPVTEVFVANNGSGSVTLYSQGRKIIVRGGTNGNLYAGGVRFRDFLLTTGSTAFNADEVQLVLKGPEEA